jgi:hypothetical protein
VLAHGRFSDWHPGEPSPGRGRGAERPGHSWAASNRPLQDGQACQPLVQARKRRVSAIEQHFDPFITVTARASRDNAAAVGSLRRAIRRADPDVAIEAVGTGRAMLTGPYVFLRFVGVSSLSLGPADAGAGDGRPPVMASSRWA